MQRRHQLTVRGGDRFFFCGSPPPQFESTCGTHCYAAAMPQLKNLVGDLHSSNVGCIVGISGHGRHATMEILTAPDKELPDCLRNAKQSIPARDMRHIAATRHGYFAAAWSGRDNRVLLWDIRRGHHIIDMVSNVGGCQTHIVCVSWSPDGKYLVTCHAEAWENAYEPIRCYLQKRPWRGDISDPLDKGAKTMRLQLPASQVPKGLDCLEWSGDGKYLAVIAKTPYTDRDVAHVMPSGFCSPPIYANRWWFGWSPNRKVSAYAVEGRMTPIEVVNIRDDHSCYGYWPDNLYRKAWIVNCLKGSSAHYDSPEVHWSPCGTKIAKISVGGWSECAFVAEVWDTQTGKIDMFTTVSEPCKGKTPKADTLTCRWHQTTKGPAILVKCMMCGGSEDCSLRDAQLVELALIGQTAPLRDLPDHKRHEIMAHKMAIALLPLGDATAAKVIIKDVAAAWAKASEAAPWVEPSAAATANV